VNTGALFRVTPAVGAPPQPGALACLGLVAIGYVVFCITYLPINALTTGRQAHTLFLPGEVAIPLVPVFEFPYASAYVLPLVLVWRRPEAARLGRLVRAFAITLVSAYTIYLLLPVYFPRPTLTGHSLATRLLAFEYLDKPYNNFPSLHVGIAILVAFACADDRRLRRWLPPLVALIAVSTVFVKQHYILDVLAGAALAIASWRLAACRPR